MLYYISTVALWTDITAIACAVAAYLKSWDRIWLRNVVL